MQDIESIVTTFFDGVWKLMTGVTVPGFGVSVAVVALGFLFIRLAIAVFGLITGFGGGVSGQSSRFRTGKEHIDDYRKSRNKRSIGFDRY